MVKKTICQILPLIKFNILDFLRDCYANGVAYCAKTFCNMLLLYFVCSLFYFIIFFFFFFFFFFCFVFLFLFLLYIYIYFFFFFFFFFAFFIFWEREFDIVQRF